MKKFAKFWKAANFRLKFGLIVTLIFFIIGFVVYYDTAREPRSRFNTYPNKAGCFRRTLAGALPVWVRTLCGC